MHCNQSVPKLQNYPQQNIEDLYTFKNINDFRRWKTFITYIGFVDVTEGGLWKLIGFFSTLSHYQISMLHDARVNLLLVHCSIHLVLELPAPKNPVVDFASCLLIKYTINFYGPKVNLLPHQTVLEVGTLEYPTSVKERININQCKT